MDIEKPLPIVLASSQCAIWKNAGTNLKGLAWFHGTQVPMDTSTSMSPQELPRHFGGASVDYIQTDPFRFPKVVQAQCAEGFSPAIHPQIPPTNQK
jgi:hypothetical protein